MNVVCTVKYIAFYGTPHFHPALLAANSQMRMDKTRLAAMMASILVNKLIVNERQLFYKHRYL